MDSLPEIARHHAGTRPEALALTDAQGDVSYGALADRMDQVAGALAEAGIRAGERVAVLARNCAAFLELMLGVNATRAVLVPLNWRLAEPELAVILEDCGARLLFSDAAHAKIALRLARTAKFPVSVVGLDDDVPGCPQLGLPRAAPAPAVSPDDVAVQLYTSGTTGRPKGVMLRHRNFTEPRRDYAGLGWTEWAADDVSLVAMPLFHVGGLAWLLLGFHAGAPSVVAPEFDADRVLDLIAARRVTRLFLVPSALGLLLRRHAERPTQTGTLRLILYGASPMPLDLLREGIARFGCGFVQNYGMTETFGGVVALDPHDHAAAPADRLRSAGRAMPGVELAILDGEGRARPAGQVGQVAIRSAANMLGYWNRPEATAATIDPSGWLRTGDAGHLDGDGYLFVHDRIGDMIITGGENVYPSEVEDAIFGHPKVSEVGVVGVADALWGEAVMAFVVPRAGETPTLEEIAAWTKARIAAFKAPKRLELVEALPRNAAGKVLRRVLRQW